jgi:hypothetical protein
MVREYFFWRGDAPLGVKQQEELAFEIHEATVGRRTVLKRARRRCVFRLQTGQFPQRVIVKAFPLDVLAAFRYQKYALREFQNHSRAAVRGTPSPEYYGYFEVRRLGLVRIAALVMQDLGDWLSLSAHLQGANAPAARAATVAVLAQMFEAGVNHIDTTPDNFLLSGDLRTAKLIDWQYASFGAPRALSQILLQTGRLLLYADIKPESDLGRSWVMEIHQASKLQIPLDDFASKVRSVMRARQPYRDRLALRVHFASGAPSGFRLASQNSTVP